MRFGSIIRPAGYIAILGCVFAGILFRVLPFCDPYGRWLPVIVACGCVMIFAATVVLILRRFLFRQFDALFRMVEDGRLTEKELDMLSGNRDELSKIKKSLMEWSRGKALEIDHLKQMEKYRKEFLGNVSHELKTPIFNLQGYLLTLLDGGLEDKSVNRLYLERSEKSINRMIHIVEDLESIARLESGELQLDTDTFDMFRLTEEVFEMYEMSAREAGISLKVEQDPAWVSADRKRITEVMDNLIANSVKYGRKNGTTHVSFAEKDNLWLISVADDGIGIAEKDCKRIFERFYRCDKSRSREQGGTGLGLAIAKHIVEAHGQTISVQSVPGRGSTFTFSLPVSYL